MKEQMKIQLLVATVILVLVGVSLIISSAIQKSDAEFERLLSEEWDDKNITLITGEKQGVKGQSLIYAGMTNVNTFSLTHGGSAATNIYYSINSEEIIFGKHNFEVLEVNSEYLKLIYKID